MKTARAIELAARREARAQAMRDNAAGFRAALAGEPIPGDASPAFRAGYAEATAGDKDGKEDDE